MSKLSSWLITIFVMMFWAFRVVVAIMGSMGLEFVTTPINNNIEIALLFIVLICIPLIFKRKLWAGIVYAICYGGYFGKGLLDNVMKMLEGEKLGLQVYTDTFFSLIAIALPILVIFDIMFDKNRTNNPKDKKTDWFYKNEAYDRKFDERADKNNYRNY